MTDGERLCMTATGTLLAAVVAWQVLATAVCVAAQVWPRRPVLTRCAAHVPRFARRLAASACGAALLIQPATAYAATDDEPVVRTPAAPAPQPIAVAEPAVAQPVTPPPGAVPEGTHHLVVPGDNLWRIAAVELARRWGAPPDDNAIARYWRAVVDANRATLRSGDPNLIHPGELVVLPAD